MKTVVVVVSPSSGWRASIEVGSKQPATLWPPKSVVDVPDGARLVTDHADTAADVGARSWLYPLRVGTVQYLNADRHAWHTTGSGLASLHARARWVAEWTACMKLKRRRRKLPVPPQK
jgi:hypothetical protein